MTIHPSPPRAFVSILSRNSHKPLPRWVHRRSRGEGQYGRRSCGTLDIQSAFCEPGRLTIKIIQPDQETKDAIVISIFLAVTPIKLHLHDHEFDTN